MRRPLQHASLLAAALLIATLALQVSAEGEARADFFEVWGQGQGGYLIGAGSEAMGGSGMPYYGFAAGVEVMYIDAFIDIRLEEGVENGGTWNQLGLGFDTLFNEDGTVRFYLGGRAGYVYARFSDAAREAYAESGDFVEGDDPSNKGLNFSSQAGLDIHLWGPLSVGAMADLGYHVLLPDGAMGVNFHALGYLRLGLGIL